MNSEQRAKTFFFQGNPVGYFEDEPLPTKPGNYRYVPYRGVGHYRLMGALKSEGPQRCYYIKDGKKLKFTVQAWVSYGLLQLSEFDSGNSQNS